MELEMLYPYNCELFVQLLEQLLLLHHDWLSHICMYSSLSKKKGEIPLVQLFKKGTVSQWWYSTADLDIYFMVSFAL